MLTTNAIFNVIDTRRVNLIVGAEPTGAPKLKVEVLPSTFAGGTATPKNNVLVPSSAPDQLWEVPAGDSLRIPIPATGNGYDLRNGGYAAVRAESTNGVQFVAYVALAGPRDSNGVGGTSLTAAQYRIPILDAPAGGTQNVKVCITPVKATTTIKVRDVLNNADLLVENNVPVLHNVFFDRDLNAHTQIEVVGTDLVAVSALVARNNRFRIYPAGL